MTFLVLADLILYLSYGITLATKIADQLLFWSWFVLTFIVVFGQFRKKWARTYGITLMLLTVLSLFPMGIPFLSIVAFMIPQGETNYYYKDREIRIERTTKSVIGKMYVGVIKNYLIFEKEIAELDYEFENDGKYYSFGKLKSISRTKGNDNTIILNLDTGKEIIKKK
ncbi:hypothetical protein R9C00_03655 [Flammeovirgaceae bacterium SG7u.111]|nr:hypothetical protein [Flammeovirgaceae bacterium SG7u.132]WPO36540.1 hypothetical protein R9C00_03655 [Flammeovirgaceae bacterium SG7u.111]